MAQRSCELDCWAPGVFGLHLLLAFAAPRHAMHQWFQRGVCIAVEAKHFAILFMPTQIWLYAIILRNHAGGRLRKAVVESRHRRTLPSRQGAYSLLAEDIPVGLASGEDDGEEEAEGDVTEGHLSWRATCLERIAAALCSQRRLQIRTRTTDHAAAGNRSRKLQSCLYQHGRSSGTWPTRRLDLGHCAEDIICALISDLAC